LNNIKKILKEAFKFLKKGGFIVVSGLHPFAPQSGYPRLKTQKNYNYFNSGSKIKILSKKPDGKFITYIDIHWTLQDIFSAITDSGFIILNVLEPNPSRKLAKKYSGLNDRYNRPLTIMIKARKL